MVLTKSLKRRLSLAPAIYFPEIRNLQLVKFVCRVMAECGATVTRKNVVV
jgi:hypothetical protein